MTDCTIPVNLITRLKKARKIVVLTGAGVSAESGIPTFRQAQTGLWARYDAQSLASPAAFRENPELVWRWYTWRRELIQAAEPNPAHIALAKIERLVSGFLIITQNIDGLHQLAGSTKILELHGNIHRTRCDIEGVVIERSKVIGEIPPRCPECEGLLRPDVVWFGEQLPQPTLSQAIKASNEAEVFLSVGTSSLVQPAASLPIRALETGALLVEVNPEETPLTPLCAYVLREPAGEVLPELVSRAWVN